MEGRNDDCQQDSMTQNKAKHNFMNNFSPAAGLLPSKECGENVSVPGLKPLLGSVTSVLKLSAMGCVGMSRETEWTENAKPATWAAQDKLRLSLSRRPPKKTMISKKKHLTLLAILELLYQDLDSMQCLTIDTQNNRAYRKMYW